MKNDLISRSAAIEAIEKHIRTAEEPYQLTDVDKIMNHAFEIAASCVYNLSATEPERKRGKWVRQRDKAKPLYGWLFCSECGAFIGRESNFCSECGADMREVE